MRDWLILATNVAVDAWLALILIVVGAVEAFFQGLWTCSPRPTATTSATSGSGSAAGWSPASPSSSQPTF